MSYLWWVLLAGVITALTTGLGALPFAFFGSVSKRAIARADAIAAGLMLGASFRLISEGSAIDRVSTVAGAALGLVFILVTERVLAGRGEVEIGNLKGAGSTRMVLMVLVMTVHSIAEGLAVGASFAGTAGLAMLITGTIALHNVPEGLAISAVLRPRGHSLWSCAAWSVFSSLPQALLVVPAFLFVDAVRPALPWCFGFAAGAMVFMILTELLPGAYEDGTRSSTALLASLSLIAMLLGQAFL